MVKREKTRAKKSRRLRKTRQYRKQRGAGIFESAAAKEARHAEAVALARQVLGQIHDINNIASMSDEVIYKYIKDNTISARDFIRIINAIAPVKEAIDIVKNRQNLVLYQHLDRRTDKSDFGILLMIIAIILEGEKTKAFKPEEFKTLDWKPLQYGTYLGGP